MKKVYLIITDLHIIDKILVSNRICYKNEIDCVINELYQVIEKYAGYEVNLIFLGDVYHRGYTDPTASIDGNNLFIKLSNHVNKMYTVVGNHELSYYKNNPFYTLFSQVNSEKVRQISNRVTKPKGILQVLDVIDSLEDGDVLFHFNHYGCGVDSPKDGKVNIGLFHQEIISKEILTVMQQRFSQEIFTKDLIDFDKNNVLRGYDYCFFGHMHKAYGTFKMSSDDGKETIALYYLASLGRTNHSEVQDNFLERNIPAVVLEDGHFSKVEDNLFNLLPREQCIRDEVVVQSQKKREEAKQVIKLKEYKAASDDPVKNVFEQISDNQDATRILLDLRNSNLDSIGDDLDNKILLLKNDRLYF